MEMFRQPTITEIKTPELSEMNEEILLPARILEIAADFTDSEAKSAIIGYAKSYFQCLEKSDSYILNAKRDDALDRITELSRNDPLLHDAILKIEEEGLLYLDHRNKT
jgi:hypothetical protein